MPTFYSIGVSIGIGRATKKGRNKDRGSQDADGLLPLLGNQLEKTKKKETEKQRGRLVVRLLLLERHKKKEPTPTVRSIVSSIDRSIGKTKKSERGRKQHQSLLHSADLSAETFNKGAADDKDDRLSFVWLVSRWKLKKKNVN